MVRAGTVARKFRRLCIKLVHFRSGLDNVCDKTMHMSILDSHSLEMRTKYRQFSHNLKPNAESDRPYCIFDRKTTAKNDRISRVIFSNARRCCFDARSSCLAKTSGLLYHGISATSKRIGFMSVMRTSTTGEDRRWTNCCHVIS